MSSYQNNESSKVNTAISTANVTHFAAKTYGSKKATRTIEVINPTLSAAYTYTCRTATLTGEMNATITA